MPGDRPTQIKVTYRVETTGSIEAVAAKIASDQSTGTFTEVAGETAELKARCAARVVEIRPLPDARDPGFPTDRPGPFVRADVGIEFPLDVVGTDIAALLTICLGGVFSIRELTGIRIVDIDLPDAFVRAQPGPQFGIEGSRRLTAVHGRPLIGTIIKPNLGLSPTESAQIARQLVEAGVDFIKDDEKLMNPGYSPLEERVRAVMPIILDHEQKTGKKVMYAFGLSSSDPDQMLRHHDAILAAGGNAAVVNIVSVGPAGLHFLRKRSGLVLHAHRNGWDILTRHPALGFEFSVYQKIWRLLGVDQFQVNGIGAKYWEPDDSFVRSFQACSTPMLSLADRALPVVCSGQWGGQAPETYRRTGETIDLLYLGGGGIIGHPGGPAAGVRAIRQSWEAAVQGISLQDYARSHRELAQSIERFGGNQS
ncbi:MAG TPA: 3-oxo-isoapionate-4-phosphate decarboxylase OiaX [Geminicoccus sp.]|jgi:ribulose-bisphosphate carboxylase large chain|uniref:3-oxo-isoapionate-4-phosphate decarboxylase OiaX n=1 Tax=Geminicoccus sp. TaxID=2024832 RepID=UPI002E37B99F|nr:3-oxo-isoapionate-4-phosphate decarboxylase OiaX [Geminicoccus sp.]HEX2524695.1 3-oxo-isoapionate-4-phosphate decarboxylase OiaX [Geminicoccus sp.]